MEIKIMSNLIFFVAGFIAFKLIRELRLQLAFYKIRRQVRSKWIRSNTKSNLIYNPRQVL